MSEWTDELKKKVKEDYLEADPTPENSTEIVASIAESIDKTPNAVRMVLVREGVYVKKEPAAKSAKSSGGGTRVSKEAAQDRLIEAISSAGGTVDEDLIRKLTGKASVYLAEVIEGIKED
tara:strand:- start:345 stop:704 length:360 start_codon:yes stop_codon:yes gene_type:complete